MGVQHETSWSAGLDVTWMPLERVSLSAGYMREEISHRQRQRYIATAAGETLDRIDWTWISDNTDVVNTFHGGVKATLIPKVLDWTLGANYSTALGRIKTRNLAPVTTTSARASRFPAFEDILLRLETALKYHFWKSWTASLGYVFESFEKHDWRTDTLTPFVPGVTNAIWLGADQKDYIAHIARLTLGYRFK